MASSSVSAAIPARYGKKGQQSHSCGFVVPSFHIWK
eukprot:gene15610-4694_t